MTYFILGIALLAGLLLVGRWFVSADPKILIRVLKWALIGTVLGVALFFVLTGRLALAFAALPALLPWYFRARAAARLARHFARMRDQMNAGGPGPGGGGTSGPMTPEEAWKVLGLKPGTDVAAIKAAHRRLMAGLHPDLGGSDYLAAKINQAKDILLHGQ